MSAVPKFFDTEVVDKYIRDNFRRLRQFLLEESPFLGFKFFEITVIAAVTDKDFAHGLGFVPTDAFVTFASDDATITLKYDDFTRENIRFSTSAACTFRVFVGSYQESKR